MEANSQIWKESSSADKTTFFVWITFGISLSIFNWWSGSFTIQNVPVIICFACSRTKCLSELTVYQFSWIISFVTWCVLIYDINSLQFQRACRQNTFYDFIQIDIKMNVFQIKTAESSSNSTALLKILFSRLHFPITILGTTCSIFIGESSKVVCTYKKV